MVKPARLRPAKSAMKIISVCKVPRFENILYVGEGISLRLVLDSQAWPWWGSLPYTSEFGIFIEKKIGLKNNGVWAIS
jgi:hypothetical protein